MIKNLKIVESLNYRKILLFFILITILIRFPFFFYPFYGDAATFILMGQSTLDGNLLYDSHASIKPPLLYWFFSLLIFLSFKSFFLLHLYASIIIGSSTFLIFSLLNKITNIQKAIFISLIYPFYVSFYVSGGDILMSEHLVLVPLLFSLIIYAKKDQSTLDLLIIGILLGISSMIRSNIILPAILITFSTLLFNSHFSLKKKFFDIFLISTGGLLVLIFCLLPFLYTDSLDLFLKWVVIAPLKFANSDSGTSDMSRVHIFYTLILKGTYIINFTFDEYFKNLKIIPTSIFWILSSLSFLILSSKIINKKVRANNILLIKLMIYISGISLSIIFTNKYHSHYLIQIVPFFLILIGFMCVDKIDILKERVIRISILTIFFFSIIVNLIIYTNTNYSLKSTPEYLISNFLKNKLAKDDKVFMLDGHIIYWLINRFPITSGIHPGDIFKKELLKLHNDDKYTPTDEFKKIFEQNPKYLIFSKKNDFRWFVNRIESNDDKLLLKYFNKYKKIKSYNGDKNKIYLRTKSYDIYEKF